MATPLELITAKEKEFDGLWKRFDSDKGLIYNDPFTLKKWDKSKVPDVFSVTLPNAAIFFSKMVALLTSVSRQPTVESETLKDDEKADIVNYIQDMEIEVDALLSNKGEGDAFSTNAGYFCGRGWSARQVLLRMDGKELLTDVRDLDPRWLTYQTGMKGLEWANYRMERYKVDIEKTYNVKAKEKGVIKDFWDKKKNHIFLDNKQIDEKDNPYGYVPFVIQSAPYGAGFLKEVDSLKRTGESIFYPHRDMFEELNFMASILKTQSFDDLRPGLNRINEDSDVLDKYPPSQSVTDTENPLVLVPRRDMTNAMRNYMGLINGIVQRAGLSNIDEGVITFPQSAVAWAKILAQKQSLTLPRLLALELLYRASTKMIIAQTIQLGGSFEIGQEGMKRKYEASSLEGNYTLSWRYFAESLEDRAAKVAIGNSEIALIPMKLIRKDTLQLENPEEAESLMEIQEVKRTEPLITTLERIFSLIDEDTDESNVEAWILFNRVTLILKQREAQGVAELEAPPSPKTTQQLPVFAGRGGGGGRPAESEGEREA